MTDSHDPERLLHYDQHMYKIRAFEEQANELYLPAIMPGLTHLYAGEEVVAVGVCEPLAPHNSMFDVPDEDLDIIYDKLD